MIGLNEYQDAASFNNTHPGALEQKRTNTVYYGILALGGEVGELQNKLKKFIRVGEDPKEPENKAVLLDELGDCLWYVAWVARQLDTSLEKVARGNIEKLKERGKKG